MNAAVTSTVDVRASNATSVLRTLVLCDLVDSTALVERLGDQRAADLFRKHDRLARVLMQQHGGQEIDKTDGFLLLFERPIQAVAFALDYQRDLAALGVKENTPLSARLGIHIGDVVVWDNLADDVKRGAKQTEVEGLAKPVAARLMGLALPAQILLSGSAYEIAHRAQGELGARLERVRWRTHGRYRFKGVPDLVPVFEVGEEGVAPLKPPPWSSKAHRETPIWRRPILIGLEIAALVLAIAIPVFYLTRPEPALAFANRDWVVVGDLKNLTGEKVFDESLQSAFRIGLEQSRYVNVVPQLQVRDALKRMQRDPAATPVDRDIGSEVAIREGARALILPTIAEIGGRVRITAEVIDPRTQTSVYSDSVDGTDEASVLPSMDDLLKKLRGRLGESLASIGESSAPLANVSTQNLEALRSYSLGLQAMVDGKGQDALALLTHATELDPKFSLAYLALATITYSTGHKADAHEFVLKATADLDRLSARERLTAEAYAAWFVNPAAMREKWELYARLYPDAMTGQNNIALTEYWYENALADAEVQFSIVTASRHPRRGYAWLLLGDVQLALNQIDAARKSYVTARQVGSPQLNLDPIALDIATRDFSAGAQHLAKEPTRNFPYFETEKSLRKSALDASQGHLVSARVAAAQAQTLATGAGLEAAPQRAKLAELAIEFASGGGSATAALDKFISEEIGRLKASSRTFDYSSITHLSLAAMLALRNHQPALAERALAALEPYADKSGFFSLEQPYHVAKCEAEIEKNASEAITCLEQLVSDRAYYQTRVALLRAYQATGKDKEALETAQWLVSHRGRAVAEYVGEYAAQIPNLIASDEAELQAAELELKAGQREVARQTLARLQRAWSAPEGDPPLARRMRALAEQLGSAQQEHR